MAITRTQSVLGTDNQSGSTVAVTITAPPAGSLVCGIVSWSNATGQTLVSVKDSTNATYNTLEVDDGTNLKGSVIFWLGNVSNSPTSVTATFSASTTTERMAVDVYSGVLKIADPSDGKVGQLQALPGTGTDGATSGNFTTTVAGDLIYGAVDVTGGVSTQTAGTNFTIRNNSAGSDVVRLSTEDRIVQANPSASTVATFTMGTSLATITYGIAFLAEPNAIVDVYPDVPPAVLNSKRIKAAAIAVIASGLTFVDPIPNVGFVSTFNEGPVFSKDFIYQSQARPVVFTSAETVTVDKWFVSFTNPPKAKAGLPVALQRDIAITFPTVRSFGATSTIGGPEFFTYFIYQSIARPPAIVVSETITVDKWYVPWEKQLRPIPGLPAASQQALAFTALLPNIQPVGPVASGPTFSRRLIYQELAYTAFTPSTEVVTVDKWFALWRDRLYPKKGIPTGEVPYFVTSYAPTPTPLVSGWVQQFTNPPNPKRGLQARFQQAQAFNPSPPIVATINLTMAFNEGHDTFLGFLYQTSGAPHALVSITQSNRRSAYTSVVESS